MWDVPSWEIDCLPYEVEEIPKGFIPDAGNITTAVVIQIIFGCPAHGIGPWTAWQSYSSVMAGYFRLFGIAVFY
jgi:hypothetical protein